MTDEHPWSTIYQTLCRSMGHWIEAARLRQAASDITQALGFKEPLNGDEDMPTRTGPDAPLINALQRLLDFRPDGYSEKFAGFVSKTDWADEKTAAKQAHALNDREAWAAEKEGRPVYEVVEGARTGRPFRRRLVPDPGTAPFLSETVYYPILDKEDARTFRHYLDEVRRLAGLDEENP